MTTGSETASAAVASVRDRLIDAAEECLRAKGIRATVSAVAETAEVSRGWLYRRFPEKAALLGAALVRLNDAYWGEAHAILASVDGLAKQITAGVTLGRKAYDSPGALLMRLRRDEPEEFAACAGAGIQGLARQSPRSGSRIWPTLRIVAKSGFTDLTESAEWVAARNDLRPPLANRRCRHDRLRSSVFGDAVTSAWRQRWQRWQRYDAKVLLAEEAGMPGYVYWGSGTADCDFGADSYCVVAYPERKDETTQFTAYLDESEAKDSEERARGVIAIRARNKAHQDHDCWRIRSVEFDIKRKQVGR